jgi:hypothetical protein
MKRQGGNAMRTFVASLIAIGFVFAAGVGPAQAQPFDHYKCYKTRDTAAFKALVDLNAFQTQFNVDPMCTVVGRGKLFCVPVQKTVLKLAYPAGSTLSPVNMPGQDLADDRICYKVKCPINGTILPEEVQDQFGRRDLLKFKVQYLCTNAIKTHFGTTTTTTISTTTTSMPNGTTTTTMQTGLCKGAVAPMCNGLCPNPTDVCKQISGTNSCDCFPPTPCSFDPTTQMCGGDCPTPDQICVTFPTGCDCVVPCGLQSDGTCGGYCPNNLQCLPDSSGLPCSCQ